MYKVADGIQYILPGWHVTPAASEQYNGNQQQKTGCLENGVKMIIYQ